MFCQKFVRTYAGVTKEAVWQGWTDVVNWPKWDSELEYCDFKGKFEVGNSFILKPKSGPKVRIILLTVNENRQFIDYCQFFGATMYDDHQVFDDNFGIRIEHTIRVKGPLAFLWWHLVAKKVAATAPHQIDNFIRYLKSRHG